MSHRVKRAAKAPIADLRQVTTQFFTSNSAVFTLGVYCEKLNPAITRHETNHVSEKTVTPC